MVRRVRNSVLETGSNRLKLRVAKKPNFVRIGPGLSLGYRRNQTSGTWVLRIADGRGGSRTEAIGFADDHDEPDGNQFLDYWQAQERAKITANYGDSALNFHSRNCPRAALPRWVTRCGWSRMTTTDEYNASNGIRHQLSALSP